MESKHVVDIDKDLFDTVWRIQESITAQEAHFNSIEVGYRNLASKWLLATFAAIGFVLSKPIIPQIDIRILISVISFMGAIGIILLWILDLLVYHRLLDSCFSEGLKLEQKHPWLPQIRHNMMKSQKDQGVMSQSLLFYLVPVVFLQLVAGSALSLLFWSHYKTASMFVAIVLLFASGITCYTIIRKTGNTRKVCDKLLQSVP